MKSPIFLLLVILSVSCQYPTDAQENVASRLVGGPCEICDAIEGYDYDALGAVDTLPDFAASDQKLKVTGTVYRPDGKTPAPNVIVYIYQTDESGEYRRIPREDGSGKSYTYHQGWVKTDAHGQYTFYTFLPGAYPNGKEPLHIHPLIKEPDGKVYYIDAFVFDHDPLLKAADRQAMENRGGSGMLRLLRQGKLLIGRRDIILGLNVPDYGQSISAKLSSGREIGEDVLSFTPMHAWGPDKGTKTCPVCKYGKYHGVLFFVGNQPDWSGIKSWLTFLERESTQRSTYLKVYFVYGDESAADPAKELGALGEALQLKNTALTFVPSFSDRTSEVHLMEINPDVEHTIILYRQSTIIDKYIDMEPTSTNFELISKRLDETADELFYLPRFQIE